MKRVYILYYRNQLEFKKSKNKVNKRFNKHNLKIKQKL